MPHAATALRIAPALLALWLVAACLPADRPMATFEPESASAFKAPWPDDRLRHAGGLDMSGFPNPNGLPLLDRYLELASALDGFGTSSTKFVPFNGPLDPDRLPSPSESVLPGSPLLLVDVDPGSPHWGERIPVQWRQQAENSAYQPAHLLAVAPVYGFPLRPSTTYALVVTTELARRPAGFEEVWRPDHPDHARYKLLDDALVFHGLTRGQVAVASIFTTSDPLAEMTQLAERINTLKLPELDQSLTHLYNRNYYRVYRGTYDGPVFQHGDRPYASKGGGFRFGEYGEALMHSWDRMRIAVCVPLNLSNEPQGGWPVVIQAHGTGGDFRSHCSSNSALEAGAQAALGGMISIGFDQPLHGTRATQSTDPELHSFNYLNPEAGRTNFRQGAIDIVYLAHALSSRSYTFDLGDGVQVRTDPDNVLFLGHSHGGITGSLALPWLGDKIQAAVISGAGGGMAITVVDRKDPIDIAATLEQLLGFAPGEHLHELHPVVSLIQMLVDVTDPINYAPYWYSQQGDWPGQVPTPVLVTSGLLDEMTPHRTAEALAAAARMPQLAPGANRPEALELRRLPEVALPAADNALAWDGAPITAGFSQWPDDGHFPIFHNEDTAELYRRFLESAVQGAPVLHIP